MTRRNFPRHPPVFHRCKKPEQVSVICSKPEQEQSSDLNDEIAKPDQVEPVSSSLVDFQPEQSPTRKGAPARRKTSRSGSKRRAAQRLRKRKGGWPTTTGLTWTQVRQIDDLCHRLRSAGYPLNHLVTIQPPDDISSDAERKAYCYRRAGRLADKLRRRGVEVLAVRCFEKPLYGKLHLHVLAHVPRHLQDEFSGWGDGTIIHIKPAKLLHVGYITKERHPLSPDFEKVTQHQRQKSAPFRGQRWSLTPAAKALIAEAAGDGPTVPRSAGRTHPLGKFVAPVCERYATPLWGPPAATDPPGLAQDTVWRHWPPAKGSISKLSSGSDTAT